jgi:hypothetical protein
VSWEAEGWAWELDIPTNEKIVLLALANWANGDGFCYPGQQSIAKRASVSERTVRTLLDRLIERGYVQRSRRSDASGRRMTDGYQLVRNPTPPLPANQDTPTTGKSGGDNRQRSSGTENNQKNSQKNNNSAHAKTRIPDDWRPTEEHRAMAESRGLDVEEQALAFRFHAEANGRMLERWNSGFSQWLMHAHPPMRRAVSQSREVPPAPRYPDAPQTNDDWEPYFPPPLETK